ncbi:leucine-rich repeat domain-containing protein [Reichenbachiella agarivorans]|uniref:Leucine-rich repeat domain-containing protein n=1 Tax=Reichenbachiella agarivorans TaxID=2979464 RepID=A0ABY6CQ85_9BACT|nr:leucine-rich repeat domain-containing protein [Reichenbachiella agarivorans]UXP31513.1 leucine-rich repeat domain-containing protein [Reichenbachiella agarivorans]
MAKTDWYKFAYTLMFLFVLSPALAQQPAADTTRYPQVRSLVSFYEYMLNTIGSSKSTARDKEVIITESYKKVFVNQLVQIEDDLVLDRKVITNKDVAAYLRDVDFFFKDIQFKFQNIVIEKVPKSDGTSFYLVSFESKVNGTTLDNQTHSSIKKRFIEVNLNVASNDMKIASIYSTKISREEELKNWWASLSYGWINIFKSYVPFDVISDPVLFKISSLDSLSLSGNQFILDIEPLSALRDLKVLDISQSKITDLSPLRYARNLQKLKASNTQIKDINTLEYFEKLTYLDLSHTEVTDITSIAKLKQLKYLDLSNTPVINFAPLQQLSTLTNINLSNTKFADATLLSTHKTLQAVNLSRTYVDQLSAFRDLQQLKSLDASETTVSNLNGLENHPMLEIITINQSNISQLNALANVPNLKKVYADNSGITEKEASGLMAKKPHTVVVTNSQEMTTWWTTLPVKWKTALSKVIGNAIPSKEELTQLVNMDSLNLAGQSLNNIEPLAKFKRLRYLDISKNQFSSFAFTKEMTDLEYLKAKDLPMESTAGLENNPQLKWLIMTSSSLNNISNLSSLNKLELLDVEDTYIQEDQIKQYLLINPKTVVVYQSETLQNWWNGLTEDWKKVLKVNKQDSYHLHELIERQEITISNLSIASLSPLNIFINLQKVTLDRVSINSLDELYSHQSIKHLTCTNGPLQTLKGITQLKQLETLDISNTAIEDLKEIEGLSSLKSLNCSGTSIKRLNEISALHKLESLNVSNTRIWNLKVIYEILGLKSLVCNNTRVTQNGIEDFKANFPNCEVVYY